MHEDSSPADSLIQSMKANEFTEALHYYVGLSSSSTGRKFSGNRRLGFRNATVRSLLVARAAPEEGITRYIGVLRVAILDPHDPLLLYELVRGSDRKKRDEPDVVYAIGGQITSDMQRRDGIYIPFRRNTEIFCPYNDRITPKIGRAAIAETLTSIPEIPIMIH